MAQAVGLSEGTIRKALKANRLSRVKRTEAHSAPSPQRPASTPRAHRGGIVRRGRGDDA